METLADRLRALKNQHRVTIKEIARACEVSQTTVYGWLSGKMPKSKHLAKQAEYFRVTTDYLVHGNRSTERTAMLLELQQLAPWIGNEELRALLITARIFAKRT
ncbi:helix-turn-helix domain-containing protein [Chromobacterium haemolyticum]|uniref:helix-turn-helix domain-containing protein n=1 Tax=Chromobacterium haemolyticum TaxID=394935 RepID=UPI0017463DD5|nr:helix-turn-helix transcriptional regulator [Chromobacterium haemolyticum]QOD81911.1 helix-turn-helix transcriptional regulator [Chromobacterium haemolyticum]